MSLIFESFPLINFFFRGVLLILFIKTQRNMWEIVIKIFYRTRILTFLIFCVMLFFGIVGHFLFSEKSEDFGSILKSTYSLFILLSTCNFPDVMLATFYDTNKLAFFYFLLYLVINYFILFTLLKTLYYKITERSGQSAMLNISFMYCISESDGLRVFTLKNIFFISKVSKQLYNTCYPFSEDPAKKLLSAYKSAQEKQANCDKEIREIALKLGDAIKTLSQVAAGLFWTNDNDKNKQIQLYILKAAQHGKSFVQNNELNYDLFVQTCKEIRIMNNLHSCNPNQDKPRFITYAEFKQMGAKDLIKKLIRQQNFALAYDMSKYLDYNVKKVFQRYAIAKIKKKGAQSKSELTQLYEEISNQLKNIPNISYIKLAKKAFKYGAKDIGIKFLENEKSILTRIPQYIQLKEWDKAISLAFETYDRNVLLTVIDKIFKDRDIDVPKFLTIVFIVAAACCCNGLFYFKHQISGICDVIVVAESTLGNNMTSKMVFTAHGLFIKSEEYVCSPNCILADCTLDRPDYAIGAFKTKQFSWRADSGSCTAFEEKTPTVNPYSLYEGVFETKSPAVFNNHNCFAFINMTEPNLILYGNDKTGEMFGFKSGDYTVTVEYSSAQHSPETFVMDPNYENCAEDSFIPPDQQVYDEACNAIPTDASF